MSEATARTPSAVVPGETLDPLARPAGRREGRALQKSIRRSLNDPETAFAAARLRDTILFESRQKTRTGRAIGLSGPTGGEGATSISILLGMTLGELKRNRVIFIDGRLERRTFSLYSEMFGLTKSSLDYQNGCGYLHCYSTRNQNLCFLVPGGSIQPLEFFSHEELMPLFAELRDAFDYIIFDMPPLLGASVTRLLLPHLDLFFLICAAKKTTFSEVERCQAVAAEMGGAIKGVILNKQKVPFWASFLGKESFF
jgi:polysaccharide biosynthesis transport protein